MSFQLRKRFHHWREIRKTIQYATLIGILVVLILTHSGRVTPSISQILYRLDPLIILAQTIASRSLISGSIIVLATLLLTLVAGRAWCGWICPLGTTLDIFNFRGKKRTLANRLEAWRKIKYLLLVAILLAAVFTNLSLLILDPITLFVRTFTTSIWPAVDQAVTLLETVLYRLPFLQDPISQLDRVLRPNLLPISPSVYRNAALYALFFVGIVALNRIAPRFWCRYLCPLGGLLGWISKGSLFRREVDSDICRDCPLCTRVCPTGTIQPEQDYASDPSECTVCLDCHDSCRLGATRWTFHARPSQWSNYDPSRRETLAAFGITAGALALAASEPAHVKSTPHHIQPPGGLENDLVSKCVRCGACMRVCPTSGLQPAVFEAGIEGMGTPVLITRLGACDYSCNACGQVCPVEAIPLLSLEEKRLAVIGKAYIDQNRCIAWSDHRDCIVCEEMCPLPEKAIFLVPTEVMNRTGDTTTVKLPNLQRELCIGCGICETKCPVASTAAIQVYSPTM